MNGIEFRVTPAPNEPCQRCWNRVPTAVHMYWPTCRLCERCVGVLLEMKWPPFILRPLTADDYYVCADEKEWWEITQGRKALPERGV